MIRFTFPIPGSPFEGMAFQTQQGSEMQEWQRTFPDPMPHGHRLGYRWIPHQVPGGSPKLEVFLEPDLAAAPLSAQVQEATAMLSRSEEDLMTLGAEMGVTPPLYKRMSKAEMVNKLMAHKYGPAAPPPLATPAAAVVPKV